MDIETITKSPHLFSAVFLLVVCISMGIYMSLAFRIKVLTASKDDMKDMLNGKAFNIASSVQLNNAE